MASGPTFLTVAEVAAQMRVSKMTVYRLVHAGELEAVRVGRSFRVPEKRRRGVPGQVVLPGRLRVSLTPAGVPGLAATPVRLGPPPPKFKGSLVGSVVKKRRKRMSKKKHRKMLKRTRVQRRKLGK